MKKPASMKEDRWQNKRDEPDDYDSSESSSGSGYESDDPSYNIAMVDSDDALKSVTDSALMFIAGFQKEFDEPMKGNYVMSPIGTFVSMVLATLGSHRMLKQELLNLLTLPYHQMKIQKGVDYLLYGLEECIPVTDKCKLLVANGIFISKKFPVLKQYKNIIKQVAHRKSTTVKTVNFNSANADNRINKTMRILTKGKVYDCEPKTGFDFDSDTGMVLVSSLFVKAAWLSCYCKNCNSPRPFNISDQKQTNVKYMCKLGRWIKEPTVYGQMVELPFQGDKMSLVIVVPNDGISIEIVETQMKSKLTKCVSEILMDAAEVPQIKVCAYVPCFKMECNLDVTATLQSQMQDHSSFSTSTADFSGISTLEGLCLTSVISNVVVEVSSDQYMNVPSEFPQECFWHKGDVPVVTANKPFLYYLMGQPAHMTQEKVVLAQGRVVVPRAFYINNIKYLKVLATHESLQAEFISKSKQTQKDNKFVKKRRVV